jgi:type I restriction enzyme S subunit
VKRYPEYKDSGVPWLGQVPAHWGILRYKNVFKEKTTEEIAELPAGAISYGEVVYKDEGLLYAPTKESYQEVLKGDYLINPINLNYDLKSLRTALSEINVCVSPAYIVLSSIIDADPIYLKYQLHLFDLSHMKTLGAGVRQTISFSDIGVCTTVIPPREEQKSISVFLDKAVGMIDSAISSQEKMGNLLQQRIENMVLRAINAKEVRKIRIGQAAKLVSRPIEAAPAATYTKLGLFNRGRGIFHKDDSDSDEMGDSNFFFVRKGDLIISGQFAWEGAVSIAGEIDDGCVVSHRYPVMRGIEGVALVEYLMALLCTEYGIFLLNEHSRGAAGRNRPLNMKSLLKEKIPIPPIEVQVEIANAVNERSAVLAGVAKLNKLLKERRTAVIAQAVTGQIDVR